MIIVLGANNTIGQLLVQKLDGLSQKFVLISCDLESAKKFNQ